MCAQISDAPLFNKSWSLILFFAPLPLTEFDDAQHKMNHPRAMEVQEDFEALTVSSHTTKKRILGVWNLAEQETISEPSDHCFGDVRAVRVAKSNTRYPVSKKTSTPKNFKFSTNF